MMIFYARPWGYQQLNNQLHKNWTLSSLMDWLSMGKERAQMCEIF